MDNYNRNYDNNGDDSYSKDNSANLVKVFLILFGVTFCLTILFGIGAGIVIRIEEEREEKLRQERYVQERKRLDDAYESQKKYEEEREIREKEKKRKEEEKKKREEELKKKAEENRKRREEERKKREEEAEKLYEIVSKEIEEFSKNGTKNRDQYQLMNEEELIEELNKFCPILEKYEKLESLRVYSKAHKLGIHFSMISSNFVHVAIDKDYPILLEKLIEKKVFIPGEWLFNSLPVDFYIADKDKRRCLDYVLKTEGYDLKKALAGEKKEGNISFKQEVEEGLTLLHIAAKRGNLSLAKRVLDAGVSVNNRTKKGKTPLDYAIENYQYEMVAYLLDKGAIINNEQISSITDEKDRREELIKWMKEKEKDKPKEIDKDEQVTEQKNNSSSVPKWLNRKSIDEHISEQDTATSTSIQISSYLGLTEDELIEKLTEDFKEKHTYYMPVPFPLAANPLMLRAILADIAIKKNFTKLLDLLCKPEFHPVDESLESSKITAKATLYMVLEAAELDKRDCVEVLLKNGADIKAEIKESKDKKDRQGKKELEVGKTLLHCAAQNGNGALMKRAIDAGIPLDKKTKSGKTPLYYAVKNNHYESAYILINKGAVREESLKSETKDERMLKLLETGKYSSK